MYDTAGLVLAVQAATSDFHARRDSILGFRPSGNVRAAHGAEIKALNLNFRDRLSDTKGLEPSAAWAGEIDRRDDDPVKPVIGTTRVIQCASQRGSLAGTRSSDAIMASGLVPRATGRIHE